MLSYQHGYHAGNFADVLKHLILVDVIKYLKLKAKPIVCIDTHAGRGTYRLGDAAAQKNKEYEEGIAKLWKNKNLPEGLKDYLALVENINPEQLLTCYPGSPMLMAQMIDEHDRLFFYELHPVEYENLKQTFISAKKIKTFHENGLAGAVNVLPPSERRGLVLIDPSYEIKDDYALVVEALKSMYRKFSTGCFLLWYPVVDRRRNYILETAIKVSSMVNIQLFELGVKEDSYGFGMTACGMIVVNPPWMLKSRMENVLPWLAACLGVGGQGFYRIEQLVPE